MRSLKMNLATGEKTWLTPKYIIDELGPFDLDPCAADSMPWPTAKRMVTKMVLDLFPGEKGQSAARFFYCAKASRKERGEGNNHPTVKPISLMRYLVRLVSPKGGIVLDPFCGSGSTGVAAIMEGARFIGIEREPQYAKIARERIEGV